MALPGGIACAVIVIPHCASASAYTCGCSCLVVLCVFAAYVLRGISGSFLYLTLVARNYAEVSAFYFDL